MEEIPVTEKGKMESHLYKHPSKSSGNNPHPDVFLMIFKGLAIKSLLNKYCLANNRTVFRNAETEINFKNSETSSITSKITPLKCCN